MFFDGSMAENGQRFCICLIKVFLLLVDTLQHNAAAFIKSWSCVSIMTQ